MPPISTLSAQPIGDIQLRAPEPIEMIPPLSNSFPKVADGCKYSPTCLRCPLPKCRHEYDNGRPPKLQMLQRARTAQERDMDADDIIATWPMSRRNAYRVLELARTLR